MGKDINDLIDRWKTRGQYDRIEPVKDGLREKRDLIRGLCDLLLPRVERVIRNGPATIVTFTDGTKSVVKLRDGERDDQYVAVCIAIAKRVIGSGTKLQHIVDNVETTKPREAKPPVPETITWTCRWEPGELFRRVYDKGDVQ